MFGPFLFDRCREKQRKEASRLQTVNRKLTAMNKLLMEENDRLQKQVSQLVYENGYMRQQLQSVSSFTLIFLVALKEHLCLYNYSRVFEGPAGIEIILPVCGSMFLLISFEMMLNQFSPSPFCKPGLGKLYLFFCPYKSHLLN